MHREQSYVNTSCNSIQNKSAHISYPITNLETPVQGDKEQVTFKQTNCWYTANNSFITCGNIRFIRKPGQAV